jgi:predicted ArsR family transcriptional regulator
MKSTRQKILKTLLTSHTATIKELADAVGITSISVRHHLSSLEAENLVTSTEERHGVGRPRFVYVLTEKGVEEFPTKYLPFTLRILDVIKHELSEKDYLRLFKKIAVGMINVGQENLKDMSFERRIKVLHNLLTEEGYIYEWHKNKRTYQLSLLNCPYIRLGLDYPEICIIDQTIISEIFSEPVEIKSCILDGKEHCVFQIVRKD